MIRYKKYKNVNTTSQQYGKWYARAVTELVEFDEFITHMANHHCAFSEATIRGVLIEQVKGTMDLLTTKYLRALISYEGIQRVESLPMPREALREALLNAVVHKAYESLTPIQIAVYDDKLEIFNCGYLPEGWTVDNLFGSHRSRPYNPDIANVFFRAGEIETWGRGIERIVKACKSYGCPKPMLRYSSGEMWMVFHFSEEYQKGIKEKVQESLSKSLSKNQQSIIALMKENPQISTREIAAMLGLSQMTIIKHTNGLKAAELIKRVGPAKGGRWEVL